MRTTLDVSATIRRLRELKEITRESMAAELNLSLSGYSKMERGETDLTLSKLYRIAEILDVDVAKILNFDPSTVFNISNNEMVQAVAAEQVNHYHGQPSNYTDKYVALLEKEVERLKAKVGE